MSILLSAAIAIGTAAIIDKIYTSSSQADNTGSSFNFPYYNAPDKNVIKYINDSSKNIYVTKISNNNKFYRQGAYSKATTINVTNLIKKKGGNINSKDYDLSKQLTSGTTLPNCVGWAHGRVIEIWNAAIDQGYIKKEGGQWVIPSRNNQVVLCGREPSKDTVPAGDAYTFYANWPGSDGWFKSTQYQDDRRPLPGAIICWRNKKDKNGLCGHVAVVEAVYNYGQADEYIVVSQSGYSLTGAKNIVWLQTIKRSNTKNGAPYGYGNDYKFAGFLFSPVCQLLPVGSYFQEAQSTYTLEDVELLKADEDSYKQINDALKTTGKTILKDLVKGQKVKITWFGSNTPDETDSKINLLDAVGKIISVDKSAAYPYAVSITDDNKISGYFSRDALKALGIIDE